MALVSKRTEISDPAFDTYEYSDVVMSEVKLEYDAISKKRRLLTFSNNGGQFDDIVHPQKYPSATEITGSEKSSYDAFLGMYSPDATNIRMVYAKKNMELLSGNSECVSVFLDSVPVVKIGLFNKSANHVMEDSGTFCSAEIGTISSGYRAFGQDIIFSSGDESGKETLTFAFVVEKDSPSVYPEYADNSFVPAEMAEGSPIEDPISPEMNSYDTFVEGVGTATAVLDGGVLEFNGFSVNNSNADMSYQPLFPGRNFTYPLNNAGDYENIELLGVSKDISKWVDAVNVNADPFIDLSDILENRLFGRVYEDYESNLSD